MPITKGRLARLARLRGMATGLVADVAEAGATTVTKGTSKAAAHLHRRAAQRMLRVFGDMKGLPLKAGQMLSYIDEFVPPEHRPIYEDVLGRLQMHTPPMPWEVVEQMFTEEYGEGPDTLFARFDHEPIAAASIGQVYHAVTHQGREVAVKVQYPGVVDAVHSDLANAGSLVSVMSTVMPGADFGSLLEHVTHSIMGECDYVAEAAHQAEFHAAWAHDDTVYIPEVLGTAPSCSATR